MLLKILWFKDMTSMNVPDELKDIVKHVDETFTAIDGKMSTLSKAKQTEMWKYIAHIAKTKYRNLRSEPVPDLGGQKSPEPVADAIKTSDLSVKERTDNPKKRKLAYNPEWWRGYDKLTVEQMKQILKDNRGLLKPEQQRGISMDKKEALRDKISDVRAILKKRAVLSFEQSKQAKLTNN